MGLPDTVSDRLPPPNYAKSARTLTPISASGCLPASVAELQNLLSGAEEARVAEELGRCELHDQCWPGGSRIEGRHVVGRHVGRVKVPVGIQILTWAWQ